MVSIACGGYSQLLGESGGFCPTVFSFGLRVQVDVVEWEVAGWIEKCEWRVM